MRAFGAVAVVFGVVTACEPALPKPKDPPGPTSTIEGDGGADRATREGAPAVIVTEVADSGAASSPARRPNG